MKVGDPAVTSQGTGEGEFGANQWLVDELYQQYRVDKNAVDKEWWPNSRGLPARRPQAGTPRTPPLRRRRRRIRRCDQQPPTIESADRTDPHGHKPVAKTTNGPGGGNAIPSEAPRKKAETETVEDGEDTVTALKGMTKALARNMDESLTVPTATSVRTIPAKLMIDNRIVINNHMARSRGGKVGFTHVIGWALIQALKAFASQNVFYAEIDGKPSVVAPAHQPGHRDRPAQAGRHARSDGAEHQEGPRRSRSTNTSRRMRIWSAVRAATSSVHRTSRTPPFR